VISSRRYGKNRFVERGNGLGLAGVFWYFCGQN
jgi:hypothetical protein